MSNHIEVRKSKTHGSGVFALKNFKTDEKVFLIGGYKLDIHAFWKLKPKRRSYLYRFAEDWYWNAQDTPGDFVNHSCDPNTRIVKKNGRLYLYAVKNIGTGDEITFDYSTTIAADDYWVLKCKCGSPKCRKEIKRITLLPKAIFRDYLRRKMIPDSILTIPDSWWEE